MRHKADPMGVLTVLALGALLFGLVWIFRDVGVFLP
jgi:hypothetical protein